MNKLFIDGPKAAGNLPASTMLMNDAAPRTVNWPVHRLFLGCAALLISLFISVAQINAQTQTAMNGTARADFERADAELNRTYQAVLRKLPDVGSKQKLKEKQRAWITSRDAEAARAADEARGGSMAPTIRYEKMTELTRQRIKELKAMLENALSDKGSASTSNPSISPTPAPSESEDKETDAAAEVLRDESPDRHFAMRISCESEPEDPDKIDSNLITGIDLVLLPSKKAVAHLLPSDDVGTHYENIRLVWSPDSKWCAFYYNSPRVGYTSVYRQQRADKFVSVTKAEDVSVHVEGDVRNEYIRPLRWVRPGVLLLEQLSLFQEGDEVEHQLTAGLDPKTGKFRILSKKKLPPDVREKEDYWP
jgi:uncharacterized protein YecT (DUF1311 family)